ncbi:MAG: DUF4159 domain-containing protein [Planctomycetia bacterium]|nr:DUF4159 domain-containing protein [Planctomycetia bacterium]
MSDTKRSPANILVHAVVFAAILLTALPALAAKATEAPGAKSAKAAPPRAGAGNLRLTEKDGKLRGSFTYRLTVGHFYEWNTDPTAIPGILRELAKRTGIRGRVEFRAIGLDDPQIIRNPLLMMTGNRMFRLAKKEVKNLRNYLTNGGFLYVDDCGGADWSLRNMLKEVLPDSPLKELAADHSLFRQLYNLNGVPKVVDLYKGPAKAFGATLDGRLVVVYTYDTDMPCAWERYPDGTYVHVIEKKKREQAMRFGVNVLLFALRKHVKEAQEPAEAAGKSSLPAPARLPRDAVRNYPMRRRLPTNFITAMASDERHVWFGGFAFLPGEDEGLGRFDKSTGRWRIFMDAEGVLADEINTLTLKGDKVLVGADTWKWSKGMATFDPARGTWKTLTTKEGLPHNRVITIAKDGDDLWIACRRGIGFLAGGAKRVTAVKSDVFPQGVAYMIGLMVDKRYVWANHFAGVARFDKQAKKWEALADVTPLIPSHAKDMAFGGKYAWFLPTGPKGVQLVRYEYKTGKFVRWDASANTDLRRAISLAVYKDELWVGTRGEGIYRFKTGGGEPVHYAAPHPLPEGQVKMILPDKRYVWATVLPYGGLWRFDRTVKRWERIPFRTGTPATHVLVLSKTDRGLYVGTLGSGLWLYDGRRDSWQNLNLALLREGQFYAYLGDSSAIKWNNIYAIVRDGEKHWLGTNHGLIVQDPAKTPEGFEIIGPVGTVCKGLAMAKGHIWMAGADGAVTAYDPKGKKWVEELAWRAPAAIGALCVRGNSFYVATEKGLFRRPLEGGEPVQVGGEGLADAHGLWPTPAGLWVASGRGLALIPGDGNKSEAIAGSDKWGKIHTVVQSGGAVLVGTDLGLLVCDSGGKPKAYYNRKSGLVAPAVAAIAVGSENVWLGTLGGGISRIKLEHLGLGKDSRQGGP